MSFGALALVLLSALLHAAWNAVLSRHPRPRVAATGMLAVTAVVLAVCALASRAVAFPRPCGALWSALAGACDAGYFATLAIALRAGSLGGVYAISRGGALLVVWPISALLLGEVAGEAAVLGLVTVGLGLVCVARGTRAPSRARVFRLGWAAACSVFVGLSHLASKQALSAQALPFASSAVSLAVSTPVSFFALGRDRWQVVADFRHRLPTLLGVGLLSAASIITVLLPLAVSGAGRVATARNTSILFAQGFAWALGQRPNRSVWVGAVLVTAGAIGLGLA